MNDRNQRNTAPRKLPGIHPEYIIHTGVPAGRGASTLLGQGVAYPGTAPKEEKRAREELHDRGRVTPMAHHVTGIAVVFNETTPQVSATFLFLIVRLRVNCSDIFHAFARSNESRVSISLYFLLHV